MPNTSSGPAQSDQPLTQAERSARAAESMVTAAIELLNTVGVQGTTLVAIGEKSGYSRGLATHHFGSKAGLFRAVLRHVSAIWSDLLGTKLAGKTGLSALETAIDTHLGHALRHPEYIRVQNILWGAALDPASEFKPNVAEFMRIQRRSVAAWIREGQERCEVPRTIDPERIAEQFYGGLIGINNQWLVSPDFDLTAACMDFKQSMVRLLRTPPIRTDSTEDR